MDETIFPLILQKNSKYFSFDDSRFSLTKEKMKSARGFIFKYLKNMPKSITIETSYMGYKKEN